MPLLEYLQSFFFAIQKLNSFHLLNIEYIFSIRYLPQTAQYAYDKSKKYKIIALIVILTCKYQ